jgi:hypothetical protein
MQTNTRKKLLGLFAFSPWILSFVTIPFLLIKSIQQVPYAIGFIVILNLYGFVILIYFMIVLQKLKLKSWKKWLWRALFIFAFAFAIPFFWYEYIWKDK